MQNLAIGKKYNWTNCSFSNSKAILEVCFFLFSVFRYLWFKGVWKSQKIQKCANICEFYMIFRVYFISYFFATNCCFFISIMTQTILLWFWFIFLITKKYTCTNLFCLSNIFKLSNIACCWKSALKKGYTYCGESDQQK